MQEWKTKNKVSLINNKWIRVDKNHVELPNGIEIEDFYSVSIPNASAIVALDSENNIILKNEYRYCLKRDLIEIPAGAFEPDESDGLTVAKRELLEETGCISDDWTFLGATVESSAKLTNYMHLYLAKNCQTVSLQHLDDTEELELIKIPFEKAIKMVMSNEICCNSSANAILKAARILGY